MKNYLIFIAGLGIMASAGACRAEALLLDKNADTCQVFEALNGPDNVPEECRKAHQAQPLTRGISVKKEAPAPTARFDRAMLPDISFDYGSDELSSGARQELDKVAAVMAAPQSVDQRYRVEGNTDRKGSAAYNRQLSLARAESVKEYLMEKGVSGQQLSVVGNGFNNLLDPAHPYDGINRRVEFLNQSVKTK
jgi:outer membrane protein OmpA-like peptidoglycan-associated protein